MNLQKYQNNLLKRKKTKSQSTKHQNDALETARLLNDLKNKGMYFRLFGVLKEVSGALVAERDYILANDKKNPAAYFWFVINKNYNNPLRRSMPKKVKKPIKRRQLQLF